MYFERKIDADLDNWIKKEKHHPALLVGIRQCGKTETVREFAKRNRLRLIEMNFWTHPEYSADFDGDLEVDTIVSNIALRFPKQSVDPEKTILFFDEIQDCPRASLSFKNFSADGRYLVIGSGSYLGINGYVIGDTTPAPTGYDDVFQMKTLDYEEFLWAVGYKGEQTDRLINYFEKREAVPENVHRLFEELFLKYISIGGFPKVVSEYAKTKSVVSAYRILESTIFDMKTDFGRRKGKRGNPVFQKSEISRIQSVFALIPTFLSKENKRFIVSKVSGGTQYAKNDAINYLEQAHIVSKVHNVTGPSLPFAGTKIESQFKLFPEDIGIVMAMYGIDTVSAINQGNLGLGKGAIYEAAVFDSLNKAGIRPYYFAKESGLEIDFLIPFQGFATLVEAKAKNGNTKSSKTIMSHPEHYGKTKLLKIGNYNIGEEGDVLTIPHYMVFALGKNRFHF